MLFVATVLCGSCVSQEQERPFMGYDLSVIKEEYHLPKELVEVSGAAHWKADRIALVQDEDDIVYIYDTKKKEVVDEVKFHKDGDHEGVASDGGNLYVVRSDGHLFRLEDLKGKKTESEHWNNELKEENDVEGLCFDKRKGVFLIACKGKPGAGLKAKQHRTVWSFNTKKKKLSSKPFLVIDKVVINAKLSEYEGKEVKREFAPSAIEVHPITGDIWMVAAQGNVLVVYDRKGKLLDAIILPSGKYRQPEALTFAPNGDLFIANEGGKHKARMYRFGPSPAKK